MIDLTVTLSSPSSPCRHRRLPSRFADLFMIDTNGISNNGGSSSVVVSNTVATTSASSRMNRGDDGRCGSGCENGLNKIAVDVPQRAVVDASDPFGLYKIRQPPKANRLSSKSRRQKQQHRPQPLQQAQAQAQHPFHRQTHPYRQRHNDGSHADRGVDNNTAHIQQQRRQPEFIIRLDDYNELDHEQQEQQLASSDPTAAISTTTEEPVSVTFTSRSSPTRRSASSSSTWSSIRQSQQREKVEELNHLTCHSVQSSKQTESTSSPLSSLSWHELVAESQWSQWFDELMTCQRRGTYVADDRILDANQDTTLLHVAAWKAPPALMLLLLDVLTSRNNNRNNGSSHGSNVSPMNDSVGTTGEARTRQYLLCGDSNGNTPLHLACANLEGPIVNFDDHEAKNTTQNGSDGEPPSPSSWSGVDFSVIKNLLVLGKEALEMQNNAGDTPLHLLLASDAFRQLNPTAQGNRPMDGRVPKAVTKAAKVATQEAIASLLHMASDLVLRRNQAGLTPLHVAISNHCYEPVVLDLLQAVADQTDPATLTDHHDMIPLHYIAAFGGSAQVALELIAMCPDSICCQTVNGDTPLHLLVSNAKDCATQVTQTQGRAENGAGFIMNEETKKLMLLCVGTGNEEMSPLLVQNMDGMTPLHCCAIFQTPASLTTFLLDPMHCGYYGRIASVLLSKDGSTALHSALTMATPASNHKLQQHQDAAWYRNAEANALALVTPEACAIFDTQERSPLMLAVAQGSTPSHAVVKALLAAFPKGATVGDSKGFLPIHFACQNHKIKVSSLKALIRAFPASVSSQTKRGNTPLAEAAKYRLSYAAMELLIEEYPEALQQRNFKGERPLERAVAAGAKSSFVALLEKATEGGQLSLMAALRVDRAIRAPSHPGDVYRARRHR